MKNILINFFNLKAICFALISLSIAGLWASYFLIPGIHLFVGMGVFMFCLEYLKGADILPWTTYVYAPWIFLYYKIEIFTHPPKGLPLIYIIGTGMLLVLMHIGGMNLMIERVKGKSQIKS